MKPNRPLGLLAAAPAALLTSLARAQDPAEGLRQQDLVRASGHESASALEDLELLSRWPGRESMTPPGHLWVALSGAARVVSAGRDELSALVLVNVPLERIASAPVLPARVDRGGSLEQGGAGARPAEGTKPRAQAEGGAAAVVVPVRVSPRLARSCVRAAWRAHGVADEDDPARMASRSRLSAALPEVGVRASRGWDQSWRLTPTDADPYRTQEGSGTTRWIEGRLTWRLDRLVFADEEIPIERLRMQRIEVRGRIAGKVLAALFEWQRAIVAAADPALSVQEHVTAVLREAEAEAELDVLTDGWFSQWRATAEK